MTRAAKTCQSVSTYTLSGPSMAEQDSEVQYSDTTPYIRFTWLKNEIAETDRNTHTHTSAPCHTEMRNSMDSMNSNSVSFHN